MTAFKLPDMVRTAPYSSPSSEGLFIDVTTANQGYVTAGCVGKSPKCGRLKFQAWKGGQAYNYDFDPAHEPVRYPVNMGDGVYYFQFMENIEGNTYAQMMSVEKRVRLNSKLAPYTIPTVFCDYDVDGPCVRIARLLLGTCRTETQALDSAYKWAAGYLSYDYEKAKSLSSSTAYVPDPDATLRERKGICFDYASMCAAMLRCCDVPCRVVTGYVDDEYYHAWVVAYADGRWRRRDPTFRSTVGSKFKASDYTYKNRFIY